jgi:hypothetical protein
VDLHSTRWLSLHPLPGFPHASSSRKPPHCTSYSRTQWVCTTDTSQRLIATRLATSGGSDAQASRHFLAWLRRIDAGLCSTAPYERSTNDYICRLATTRWWHARNGPSGAARDSICMLQMLPLLGTDPPMPSSKTRKGIAQPGVFTVMSAPDSLLSRSTGSQPLPSRKDHSDSGRHFRARTDLHLRVRGRTRSHLLITSMRTS